MEPTAALLIRGNPAGNRAEKTGQQKTADKKTGRQLTPNHHRRLGELTSGFRSSQPDGRRIFTSQAHGADGPCDLPFLFLLLRFQVGTAVLAACLVGRVILCFGVVPIGSGENAVLVILLLEAENLG